MNGKTPTKRAGGLYLYRSDKPKTGLVRHLADFLNKKYAEQWKIDMPKEKHPKIRPEGSAANEHMEVAAYYQWRNRGCPPDDSLTDWVNAREELYRPL